MGTYTDYLCYKIWYAAANDKKNEVNFTSLLVWCVVLYSLQGLGFIPLPPPSGNNGCSSKLL